MDARNQRVLTFMEMRHYLSLARKHDEIDLQKKITDANHFYVRITNMVPALVMLTRTLHALCTHHV